MNTPLNQVHIPELSRQINKGVSRRTPRICILFLSMQSTPSKGVYLADTVFNKPLEIQQCAHLGVSSYQRF